MASAKTKPLAKALTQLEAALKQYAKGAMPHGLEFLAMAKAFEVAVEYAWKELQRRVRDEGVDVQSPKDAVRQAARLGIIHSAEQWIEFINIRNNSVHDYFEIAESTFANRAKLFLQDARMRLT